MSNLKSTLFSKKWFGFDLDDTLHEFRKASFQASQDVFQAINIKEGIDVSALRATYQHILRTATANAFTDGRSSTEYQRERFSQLLQAHGVVDVENDTPSTSGSTVSKLDTLLGIYKSSLESNLALKPGIMDLLQTIRGLGKRVIVITEGPADAQEWTVRKLGIESYTDVLVTTNEVGKSKVDGLFEVVLNKNGIDVRDIVYFGDNEVRDVHAASDSGILAVLYDEKRDPELDNLGTLRLNSWKHLQGNLQDDTEPSG